jgi:lysophospholipase L1-like esterase
MSTAGTFLLRTLGLMTAAGIGLLPLPGTATVQRQDCPVPASFYDSEPTVPRTAVAIARGQTMSIVAIGGASTLGGAAGSPDLAWPARLAVALTSRFPAARVTVDNRGVARETAQEMVARLNREAIAPKPTVVIYQYPELGNDMLWNEVIALKPTLVIWETGTTDAVRGTDVDEFRQTIQAGIDRLRAAEVEVVLMDMQFSRRTHAVIKFERYESVLREVTDANNVPLFRRHDIMHHWEEIGVLDLRTGDPTKFRLIAARLYDCIGRAVADFITRGTHPGEASPQ